MLKILLLTFLIDAETGEATPGGVVPIFPNFATCEIARDGLLQSPIPPNTILRARCVSVYINGSP